MTDNPKAVPLRRFRRPMDWASNAALGAMHNELARELYILFPHRRKRGADRNGLTLVDTELRLRGAL